MDKGKLAIPLSEVGIEAKAVGYMGLVLEYTDGRCISTHGPIAYHPSYEGLLGALEREFPASDPDRRAAALLTAYHRYGAGDELHKAVVMLIAYMLIKREGTKGLSVYGKLIENGEVIKGTVAVRYAPALMTVNGAKKTIMEVLRELKHDEENA